MEIAEKENVFYFPQAEPIEREAPAEEEPIEPGLDPLKRYLYEMARHRVLKKDEELELALRIYRYNDSEAADKLVVSNLRLVVKIALEYNTYLNVLDLIQEGNIGLIHAVRKYNPYKGTKFSTYASFWIRAYILKFLMNSWSIVKVGTTQNQKKLFYRLNREKERLEHMGVLVTPEVLAEQLDVKAGEIEDMEQRLSYSDVSLDYPVFEDGEETLMDLMETDENIEDFVAAKERRDIVRKKVLEFKQHLNEKELFILENRTIAEEPMTLQEIGERFSMSRESVRQIETKLSKSLAKNLRWSLTSREGLRCRAS